MKRFSMFIFFAGVFTLAALTSAAAVDSAQEPRHPAPDPPSAYREQTKPPIRYRYPLQTPSVAWAFHKTADGAHPNADEQQMLWLMNEARSDPAAEGIWLANTGNANVESAIDFFGVDLEVLKNEFAAISAKPPAAFDVRLYDAAYQHSLDLIARDAQDHQGQFDKIDASGFDYTTVRGNVFSYADSALYAHAGLNIDWGDDGGDGTGMQPGRGHRKAIMSTDGDYRNVGLAVVPESDESTNVGPLVVSGNYARADTSSVDHHNRFIVGTVWEDFDCSGRYDPGEGFADVQVMPDSGAYYAVTAAGGGYAIPATAAGTYLLTFSGGGLPTAGTRTVTVGEDSVLADYRHAASAPAAAFRASPQVVCTGAAVVFEDESYPCSTARTWSFSGGSPASSAQKRVDVTYGSPGTYTVTLTPENAVGAGASLTRSQAVSVFSPPPSGCAAGTQNLSNSFGMGIYRVAFGTIDKASDGAVDDGGYRDFACSAAAFLAADVPHRFSVKVGSANDEHVGIYVDGNGDGDFSDPDEALYTSASAAAGVHTATVSFDGGSLPLGTLLRLRVKSDFESSFDPSACSGPQYGQVEDFGVVLTRLSLADAVRVLQALTAVSGAAVPPHVPDVDADGRIDSAEAIYVLQQVAGARSP